MWRWKYLLQWITEQLTPKCHRVRHIVANSDTTLAIPDTWQLEQCKCFHSPRPSGFCSRHFEPRQEQRAGCANAPESLTGQPRQRCVGDRASVCQHCWAPPQSLFNWRQQLPWCLRGDTVSIYTVLPPTIWISSKSCFTLTIYHKRFFLSRKTLRLKILFCIY